MENQSKVIQKPQILKSLCGCLSIPEDVWWVQVGLKSYSLFSKQVKVHYQSNPLCLVKALEDTVWKGRVVITFNYWNEQVRKTHEG